MAEALGARRRWGEGGGGLQAGHSRRGLRRSGGLAPRKPPPARAARYSKKNSGHLLRTPSQRYERIGQMKNEFSIQLLCEVLEVAQSGYYDWKARQESPSPRA